MNKESMREAILKIIRQPRLDGVEVVLGDPDIAEQILSLFTKALNKERQEIEAEILAARISELKELIAVWNEVRLNPITPDIAKPAILRIKQDVEERIESLSKGAGEDA